MNTCKHCGFTGKPEDFVYPTGNVCKECYKKQQKKRNDEYRKNNKEKIAKQSKKYRENNKEKIAKGKKKYQQDNKDVSVVLSYPTEQIRYLSTLPQLGLSRYPTASLPASTREQITQQLRPLLDGQSEEMAVNRLLNFV